VPNLNEPNSVPKRWYRPEQRLCPVCRSVLKRHHILWHKRLIFLSGPEDVASWAYRCPDPTCAGADQIYCSAEAESVHLKYRHYSREVVVHIGYRRFWQHQTMYEIHEWLTQDLGLRISKRQVLNVIGDFLALLRAAQPAKVRERLKGLDRLVIGMDGMKPEKGNTCLYIVREAQLGLTLMAENLDDSVNTTLRDRLFEPLKALASELGLAWQGVVSDAQESIRLAVAKSLPGVPHQACQFHCLSAAGELTFEADRSMKKHLKAAFRQRLARLERRIARLPETDLYRAVLADYADAIRSTLLVGGVAPFELGGVWVFEALTDLAASLARCQKRGTMCSYGVSSPS
jgi:hypothetical protein